MKLSDWGKMFSGAYAPAGVSLGENNNVYDATGNFWGTWGSGVGFTQGGTPNKAASATDTASSTGSTTNNSSLSGLLSNLLSLYTGNTGGNVGTGSSLTSGLATSLTSGADDSSNLMVRTGDYNTPSSNIVKGGLNAGLTFEPLSSYYTGSTPATTTSSVPTSTTQDSTATTAAVQNAINLQSGAAWNQNGLNFPNYSALGKNKFQDLFD